MSHAHHFLSRLDRLARPHVELALALYRDDERLRYVIEQARVPEGAERVAVSLDDPHEGPFVLVTRTGRFVTCLGSGMRASNLLIITRAQLDTLSAKHAVLRQREAARERLVDPGGGVAFLLKRLLEAGPFLAREEFQALAALTPLLGEEYFDVAIEWTIASHNLQTQLKPALKKRGTRLWPVQIDKLRVCWQTFYAAGHLANLALADGGEMLHRRAEGDEARYVTIVAGLTAVVVAGGNLSKTARGAWALGQLGERWIPHATQRLATAKTAADVLGAALALIAIGARDEALRPRVRSALLAIPTLDTEEARSWALYLGTGGANLLGNMDTVLAAHQRMGAALAVELRDHYPATSPYHYTTPEAVPADIAFAEPFQLVSEFGRDPKMLPHAISMVVPAARAAPEELYLPRGCVEFLETKWEPEDAWTILTGWFEEARKPAPRPTGPARQGPCPCGSGKKYKRCCGAAETA
jgi:hypothetical protein